MKKILIIDDDPSFIATMQERLDFEGYEVVAATDGDEGLDAVERERPDLVVLDILMPKLNGYAFLKMLKARHDGKIKVIICTARDDMMDAVKGEGISGFLVKPFDPGELVEMVNVAFRLEEAEREARRKAPAGQRAAAAPVARRAAPQPGPPSPAPPRPAPQKPVEPEPTPTPPQPPKAQAQPEPVTPAPEPEAEQKPATPKKVLIIDDEQDFVDGLKERLAFEGFEVIAAYNGQDGLELTRREKPDIILLDVMMPKIDGYMVCRLLKFDEKYQRIPIIMLTARSLDEDRDIGFSSGADDYLTKPVDYDILLSKMKRLLHEGPHAK